MSRKSFMSRNISSQPSTVTPLPRLVSFILRNAAIGSLLGVLLGGGLLLTNTAGLRTLVLESASPVVPVVLLLWGFATLIGSLYVGAAIMTLPRDEH